MKRFLVIAALVNFAFSVAIFGQQPVTVDRPNQKHDIVVNLKMVEKFQEAAYSNNILAITDFAVQYSFEEIKTIAHAYNTGNIETTSVIEINNFLARIKNENNNKKLELHSEKEIMAVN
ncbi:MAG: hypothetical protein JXB34_05790 [Bacteroidales bacterium]|nr:hypothetical protein [Bacteroidales bacterium]